MATAQNQDLNNAANWMPFASGGARCEVRADGGAIRLDYDFRGEAGFLGIRRTLEGALPDPFSFAFTIRGDAPANALEFKLADLSNENAWRWRADDFEVTSEGRRIILRESEIEFAWGPAGGGRLKQPGAVEFVVAAGPGGNGTLWIEDLRLIDRSSTKKPAVSASSQARNGNPAAVLNRDLEVGWKSGAGDERPWLQFDFHEAREFGGLMIDWGPRPTSRQFAVEVSESGRKWTTAYRASKSGGRRSFVALPDGESRFLRLSFQGAADVRRVEFQSFDFARTTDDLFYSMAARTRRGSFPRYLLRQQSYWTCAGIPDGVTCALINEEGLVEPDRGTFSIEPFLVVDGRLITWADARRSVRLEPGGIPIPTVRWKMDSLTLEITPFATGHGAKSTLFVRYRIQNHSGQRQPLKFFAAIRPHQVSPPWQRWKSIGGVSPITDIAWKQGACRVNGNKVIVPLTKPSAFGAMAFDEGLLVDAIAADEMPRQEGVRDSRGLASAALRFGMTIPAGGTREISLAVPFGFTSGFQEGTVRRVRELDVPTQFAEAVRTLSEAVGQVALLSPGGMPREAFESFQTAAGQVLINRDGPALQPGPRRYTRSWIRDGAIMGAALARAGAARPLADFAKWYAPFQRDDGFVPCCVDDAGPDWLVEHDSHGQLIYAAVEGFRLSGDRTLIEELWPAVRRAAMFIETLCCRSAKSTPSENQATRGLLPESASHEGYLAQPVHSYWDDFWGIRGLLDAAIAAEELGHADDAQRFQRSAQALRQATLSSIRTVIERKQIHYVPGSVEWADFDPTATANALELFADTAGLPEKPLRAMFRQFVTDSRKRRQGKAPWKNYTAYEIRTVGALVRLGLREEAREFLEFYLSDQRPRRWNQWPEISWRDPESPGHLGDVPHTWIGAEYMLVFASLFAYERDGDSSLVVAAGIPQSWISSRKLAVEGLSTWYGTLNLMMRRLRTGDVEIELGGDLRTPPGGIVLRPPCAGSIQAVEVDGHASRSFTSDEVRLAHAPARVRIAFAQDHTAAS